MRPTHVRRTLGLVAVALGSGRGLMAQGIPTPGIQPRPMAHSYVADVTDAYVDTPSGMGLLPTALAEAQVAIQHAELAALEPINLDAAKQHVAHVLQAVDPALAPVGPGLGYGVRRAAEGILQHMELAAAAEDASDNLATHARHIAGAARSVIARTDRIAALAAQVRSTTSTPAATSALTQLVAATHALVAGSDADGDRRVGWAEPEGGLRQIQHHMTLLERGEGLAQ